MEKRGEMGKNGLLLPPVFPSSHMQFPPISPSLHPPSHFSSFSPVFPRFSSDLASQISLAWSLSTPGPLDHSPSPPPPPRPVVPAILGLDGQRRGSVATPPPPPNTRSDCPVKPHLVPVQPQAY